MDGFDRIKTFREVALRRSFSRAAMSLGVSKGTVSRYATELEKRSGAPAQPVHPLAEPD
jgi:DNA-binding transcriptional LysR family regulator